MNDFLSRIKVTFDNVANRDYDEVAFVQKEAARILIDLFYANKNNDHEIKSIFDIGVGTGFATELLIDKYPNAFYHLNDLSENMLKATETKLFFQKSNYNLINQDIEKFDFESQKFDLIVSNFVFQWMSDLPSLLKKIINGKITKYLCFTTLVDNNFFEIRKILKKYDIKTIDYHSSSDLDEFIRSFDVKQFFSQKKVFDLRFENMKDYAIYMKKLGANISYGENNYRKMFEYEKQPININYEVYFCFVEIF